MACGSTSAARDADAEIQAIIDKVKDEVEKKLGRKLDTYVAKKVATQVVAGVNYFVKVDVGNGEFIHLRIYQTLPHAGQTLHLDGIQTGKTEKDELVYFEKQP